MLLKNIPESQIHSFVEWRRLSHSWLWIYVNSFVNSLPRTVYSIVVFVVCMSLKTQNTNIPLDGWMSCAFNLKIYAVCMAVCLLVRSNNSDNISCTWSLNCYQFIVKLQSLDDWILLAIVERIKFFTRKTIIFILNSIVWIGGKKGN